MATRPDSELGCITKSKDLIGYIFSISDNMPKKFRFTITDKLQNYSIEVLELLINANELMLGESERTNSIRRRYQQTAIAKLKIIDSIAMIARQNQCILPKQYEMISRNIAVSLKLIGAWINSDKERLQKK